MNRFCLDTSAYSQFKRGHARATARIDGSAWIGFPAVVVGEIWTGLLQSRHRERNEAELAEFLRHPSVETLPVDANVARIYGEILAALRSRGTPVPTNDIWIAATAARAGATVLTFDEHFRMIDRVSSLVLET